jgi:hypothetical protein
MSNASKFWMIVGGAILLVFLPQIPSCVMSNTPKSGKVVDAVTGKGMPDVIVIAAATFNAGPVIHGSSRATPYRIITHTDANGNYWIPSTWSHLSFGMPGTDPREKWLITAFRLGYALEGDEKALKAFGEFGRPKYLPLSIVESPKATWQGAVVKVAPLILNPVKLTLKEAAIYYRSILGVGGYAIGSPGDEAKLRLYPNEFFLSEVCGMDPSAELDMPTASALALFTERPDEAIHSLRALEPSRWSDAYHHSVFHAGNVCTAMKVRGH